MVGSGALRRRRRDGAGGRGHVAHRSAAARRDRAEIWRPADRRGPRSPALRARPHPVGRRRRHRHVRLGTRPDPHQPPRRARLHPDVDAGGAEQVERRQPDRKRLHGEVDGRGAAVQAVPRGGRAIGARRHRGRECRRQARHGDRRRPARAPGGAIRSRARLRGREGRQFFLRRRRLQFRSEIAPDHV